MVRVTDITRERHIGAGGEITGAFYLGDATLLMDDLIARYEGKVSLLYLDPPFSTGEKFMMRVRVGEKEWKSGRGSLLLGAYDDNLSREAYMNMMRRTLEGARSMLTPTGLIFLHADWRMSARLRVLMDDIFGENRFLNEIIWCYQSGGRARRYFPRKHDSILFYAKGEKYDFHIEDVAEPNPEGKKNHMKKHVDTDGRVYRSILSGGKRYTYYDDDPVTPGDVWNDVSHLQQKDPQRTGYDTQKPRRLLDRIVLSASRPGDIVMDLFAGSGTTLESAQANGRRFVGCDIQRLSMQTTRRRLDDAACEYQFLADAAGEPVCEAHVEPGVAFYHFALDSFALEPHLLPRPMDALDAVDSWAAGYREGNEFVCYAQEARAWKCPRLTGQLNVPVYAGARMLRVSDIYGRDFYYALDT